jgi:hypothetical protein
VTYARLQKQTIAKSHQHACTITRHVTIDVDNSPLSPGLPQGNYYWIRFTEPNLPTSDNDDAHVDAIEILPQFPIPTEKTMSDFLFRGSLADLDPEVHELTRSKPSARSAS